MLSFLIFLLSSAKFCQKVGIQMQEMGDVGSRAEQTNSEMK